MAMNRFNYPGLLALCVACPIRGATEFVMLARVDRYRMGIQTCQCAGCGLIRTNPMPKASDLATFYRQSYRRFYRGVEEPSAGSHSNAPPDGTCVLHFGIFASGTLGACGCG